jgi:hypothetical protein
MTVHPLYKDSFSLRMICEVLKHIECLIRRLLLMFEVNRFEYGYKKRRSKLELQLYLLAFGGSRERPLMCVYDSGPHTSD